MKLLSIVLVLLLLFTANLLAAALKRAGALPLERATHTEATHQQNQ
jgi:hypothetical protein